MKNFLVFVGLFAIAGLGYFIVSDRMPETSNSTVSPTPATVTESLQPDAEEVNKLRMGGSSFNDPKGVFTFLYPNDYKLDSENGGQYTRITKIGATQQGQTELYDGVIMVFESVELQNQTLEQWIDTMIQQTTGNGMSELIEPKKAITFNGYPGFTYTTRGLGESKYIYIQKDPNSMYAVGVTMGVHDPEQKNYQKEVDATLSTLQLLK